MISKISPELAHWDARPGEAAAIEPGVVRVLQNNPGPFTGPGTNTFLLGTEDLWILDPGEDDRRHREALLETVGGRRVHGILVSHGHEDHWPLAPSLARELDAPVWAFDSADKFQSDHQLVHGEHVALELDGHAARLRFLHTPGHCADHVSFALEHPAHETDLVFCADHVMAWSTTILAPGDGDLDAYLASLDLLLELGPRRMLPAHGPEIADPRARMQELRDHRLQRTAQLLAALRDRPATLEEIVPVVYAEADPAMHGAAAASLQAHVDSLLAQGRLERDPGGVLRRC